MKLQEILERYVFIRKCVCCGELIGYNDRHDAFCPSCRLSFERAKTDECPNCQRSIIECDCMPRVLSRAGMPVLKKLVSYDGTETSAQNRLILFLKKNKNLRVSHFVAEQLLYRLREILDENSIAAQDTVIVFLPRSPKNLAKYGFDQTELVAKELSRISGVELLPLLKRKRKNYKEQKRLDLKGRRDNVRFMFELDGECLSRLGERCIILLDDIVTSGSSMAEAIRSLRKRGVREVYGLCIAMVKVKRRHA